MVQYSMQSCTSTVRVRIIGSYKLRKPSLPTVQYSTVQYSTVHADLWRPKHEVKTCFSIAAPTSKSYGGVNPNLPPNSFARTLN